MAEYTHTHTHKHTHTYIYIHTHTYTYIHIHTIGLPYIYHMKKDVSVIRRLKKRILE
jgi:hypothetical protein